MKTTVCGCAVDALVSGVLHKRLRPGQFTAPRDHRSRWRMRSSGTAHGRERWSMNGGAEETCRSVRCAAEMRSNIPESDKDSERSAMVNEEAVLFLFQLQLDQEMQRAMSYENYQDAMEIRARREQVDAASTALQDTKGLGTGAKGKGQLEVMDITTEGLQIRSELQKAIDDERFADAAKYRDQLKLLESQVKSAEASVEDAAVDPVFALVDESEWKSGGLPPVAYVAEENMTAPGVNDGSTWVEEYGQKDPFIHPYTIWLFLGEDAAGDFIPCSQLRDKYSVDRWDVYPPGEDGYDHEDDPDDGGPQDPDKPQVDR